MRQLRQKIRVRERLPVWGLRLTLGVILFTLSEFVMWNNPPARSVIEWPVLLILYVCLAAIMMDVVARFQVNSIATLVLTSALYGLIVSVVINHSAFDNLAAGPFGVLVRGLGLQAGAGLYGLLLFVVIMRGRSAESLQVFGAMAIGALWGVWVHWYPIQPRNNWGLVSIENATLIMVVALVIVGAMLTLFAPRFRFIREKQMELLWWEAIVVGVPLFITLIGGMFQELITFVPLLIFIGVGAFIVWVLSVNQEGTDPSLLGQIAFAAPNTITYIVLAVAFLVAGIVAYSLVDGPESIVGVAVYYTAFALGTFGLPLALFIIFWHVFQRETAPVKPEDLLDDEGK